MKELAIVITVGDLELSRLVVRDVSEGVEIVDETPRGSDSEIRPSASRRSRIVSYGLQNRLYSRLKVYNEPIPKDFYDMI